VNGQVPLNLIYSSVILENVSEFGWKTGMCEFYSFSVDNRDLIVRISKLRIFKFQNNR